MTPSIETQHQRLLPKWLDAKAFLINGHVCSDFSLSEEEEDDNLLTFNIYGKDGYWKEYLIAPEEINSGKTIGPSGITINYFGDRVEIIPLIAMT